MEWRQRYYAFMRFLLQRHYGNSKDLAKLKPIRADENEPIYKVLELFQRGCKHPIIVMKNGKESGTLDENELLHAYFSEKRTDGKIGDLLYSILDMVSLNEKRKAPVNRWASEARH